MNANSYGIDEGRRGEFIPQNFRSIDAPVVMRRQEQAQQRIRDIEPTVGGGGSSFNNIIGGGNGRSQPAA